MQIRTISSLAILALLGLAGCSTAPKSESGKAELTDKVQVAIEKCKKNDADIAKFFDSAAGYAVFPTVGKGAVGIGGAYGKGELYAKGGELIAYCDLTQASIGLALGGQAYTEIIFFEDQPAFDRFKAGKFE